MILANKDTNNDDDKKNFPRCRSIIDFLRKNHITIYSKIYSFK